MISILIYVYKMFPVSIDAFKRIVRMITGYPRYNMAILR